MSAEVCELIFSCDFTGFQAVDNMENCCRRRLNMASVSTDDNIFDSVQELRELCSDKNLSFKYHDCREAERDGRGNQLFRASLTVNGVTVVRKGVTLDVAKNKAASHMISFLEENPHAMMNSSEKGISLSHPSSKLGEMCRERGLRFYFRDVKKVSQNPLRFSATATVLDVTVTAEGESFSEARFNTASQLLDKLGWEKEVKGSKTSSLQIRHEENPDTKGKELLHPCCRLHALCKRRGLRFEFTDVKSLSAYPSKYSVTATVLDETVAATASTTSEAKFKVASELLVKLGWDKEVIYEARSVTETMPPRNMFHPCVRLHALCKSRGLFFQFHDIQCLSTYPSKYTATATVLDVTVTAEAPTLPAAKMKIATQLLAKLGWDENASETKNANVDRKSDDIPQTVSIEENFGKTHFQAEKVLQAPIKTKSNPTATLDTNSKQISSIRMNAHPLFNNDKKSDITFLVGRLGEQVERVYGHSLIMSIASPVLDELFEGDWKDKEEVKIEGHPASFLSIMRYVYSQEIVLEKDHLVETLVFAKKYDLTRFIEELVTKNHLTEEILGQNIWSLLEFAYEENEDEIWHQAATFFDKHCEGLIRDNSFLYLDVGIISSLIQRPSLNVNEISLFYSTTLWAGKQCEEERVEPTAESIRSKMQPFIYHIRFPLMTGEEFRDGPALSGILTDKECYKILCAICLGDKEECGFSYKPRHSCSKTDKIKTEDHSFEANG